MAADVAHSICKSYGVEHPDAAVAFRGAFVIDRDAVVRAQHVNDLPIGRNVDELLRVIDALQFADEHGEVCPAGWKKGDKAMRPDPNGVKEYLSENADSL